MRYLVYTSMAEAQARADRAYQLGREQEIIERDSVAYTDVLKHPYRPSFAVQIHPGFTGLFTEGENQAAVELSPDWFQRGKIEGFYMVRDVPISPYPGDNTVSRRAFCNLPVIQEHLYKTFVLSVMIRHYRGDEHVWEELPDRIVELTADNEDGEYDQFYGAMKQADPETLAVGGILFRDSEEGGRKFD